MVEYDCSLNPCDAKHMALPKKENTVEATK
jgi:hypothetical protein